MSFIRQATAGDGPVEVWLSRLLPYEPKGEMVQVRADIRSALQALQPQKDQGLHAICGVEKQPFENWSIEDLLFYNIGAKYFAHLAQKRLRFERAYSVPPAPCVLNKPALSYHRYALANPDGGFTYWMRGRDLAHWIGIEIPQPSSDRKPAAFWYPLRAAPVLDIPENPSTRLASFGLSVVVERPPTVGH